MRSIDPSNFDLADCEINQPTQINLVPLEVDAYNRRFDFENNNQVGVKFKYAVLLASALFSIAVLGIVLSFEYVLLLIPVLLLHELGHLAAMTLFGYKNKYLIFMPIGAAVLGECDHVPTWQRMIVYLAGPVPGILLAFLLMWGMPQQFNLLQPFVLLLLVINCLNLLPIMPLDGGQLVNLAISTRFPSVQFFLHLCSFIIASLIAFSIQDPFVFILAAWLGFGIKDSYRSIGLFRQISTLENKNLNSADITSLVFSYLEKYGINFDSKYTQARFFHSLSSRRQASAAKSIGMMMVYLLALIGPPIIIMKETESVLPILSSQEYAFSDAFDNSDNFNLQNYIDELLDNAQSEEQRVRALLEAGFMTSEYGDPQAGLDYLLLAEREAETLALQDDLHAATLESLIEHYINHNDVQPIPILLEEMTTYAAFSAHYQEPLARSYVSWALFSDTNSGERIELLVKAAEIQRSVGNVAAEQATLEALADHYINIGNTTTARSIRQNAIERDYDSDYWLKSNAYRNMALHDALELKYESAYSNMLTSVEAWGDQESTFLDNDLGWILILNNDIATAKAHYDARNKHIEKLWTQSTQQDGSFITRMLMQDLGSSNYQKMWIDYTPWLVIAYLENNRILANQYLRDIHESWDFEYEHVSTAHELFESRIESTSGVMKFDAQIDTLVLKAIEFAMDFEV